MSTPEFDELEQEALVAAAKAGMAYLKDIKGGEEIRKRFAALAPDDAMEFLERIIDGFGSHLRHKLVMEHRPLSQGQR